MIADHYIAYNVLTPEECEFLIEKGKHDLSDSSIYGSGDTEVNKSKRSSKTSEYNPYGSPDSFVVRELISHKILRTYRDIAFSFFKAPIRQIENPQFTHYMKGDFFNWHFDSLPADATINRDLSASVILSDRNDYKGGNLTFKFPHDTLQIEEQQGMMIVFPSLYIHKVQDITDGERASIVIWGGL